MPTRASGWRTVATVAIAYVVLTVIMTWPYVNYAAFGQSSYGGDQRLIIWTLAWDNHAMLSPARLFDSNLFFPAAGSLRYNEHLFGISLFTLPWAMVGASPVLAHNVVLWLAFPLNGLAGFVFVRRFTRSAVAAFVGSLAFTFPFYVMSHANAHLHLIWLWPIPLSLLLLERWYDRPSLRDLALWVVLVVLEALSSWYLAVLVLTANALLGLVLVATPAQRRTVDNVAQIWRRRGLHLALAAVGMVLAVYPFARHYTGLQGAAAERLANSARIDSYLVPPQNSIVGRWWHANVNTLPREIWGEQTLFAGWLALTLAAVGLVVLVRRRSRDRRAWCLPLLMVVAAVASFGPSLPLVGDSVVASWLAGMPGIAGMRVPARFAAIAMLGVAGLAGVAADAIAARFGRRGRIVLIALVPLMLAEWFVVDFPAGKPRPFAIPAVYRSPLVRNARALVSLPDYWERPDWFVGGDYLLYSTAHWRPIVNGFGRTAPPGYNAVLNTVRAFPASTAAMRALGIQYVIVHAARYPDGARAVLDAAATQPGCRLVGQIASDYLFELSPP